MRPKGPVGSHGDLPWGPWVTNRCAKSHRSWGMPLEDNALRCGIDVIGVFLHMPLSFSAFAI